MKFYIYLSITVLSLFSYARSGHELGNAAHAVVCRDSRNRITSSQSLDLFEAKEIQGLVISPVPNAGALSHAVQSYLLRFTPYSHLRSFSYSLFAKNFISESQFTALPINLINDYADAAIPQGCVIEQVVLQKHFREATTLNWRYQINEEIWYSLSDEDRVAVILHEVIYRELIDHKEKLQHQKELNSQKIRLLVGNIMSDNLKNIENSAVQLFLDQALPHVEKNGVIIDRTYSKSAPKVSDEEPSTCHIPMQESIVNFGGQLLQLAPKTFNVCFFDEIYRHGTSISAISVKKGTVVNLIFPGFNSEFTLSVKAKDFLDIPNEGMKITTTSKAGFGIIRSATDFENITFKLKQTSLTVNGLEFDSAYDIQDGFVSIGVKAWISYNTMTNYKTKNFDIQLLQSYINPQEFYYMNEKEFDLPRKLYASGSVLFKGKRRQLKKGVITLSKNEKITSVCEELELGGLKCW
jgi:hypothetical protein